MQNRLDGAAEAQAASEKQLAEMHSAIAAERVARPESVNPFIILSLHFIIVFLFFVAFLGSTQRGTWSIGFCEENVN
jgi:t-SNARE complex subunit (syntaxin)